MTLEGSSDSLEGGLDEQIFLTRAQAASNEAVRPHCVPAYSALATQESAIAAEERTGIISGCLNHQSTINNFPHGAGP